MPDFPLHHDPIEATAAKGVVMLDGPPGVALSLTAGAAAESANRIARAAEEAHRQIAEEGPGSAK